MDTSKGTWKERDSRRPYYQILESTDSSSAIVPNFHGVPVLKDGLTRELPDDFAAEFVVQLPCARLFISFQDKIDGHLATSWVPDFAASNGLRLKLEPSFANSFHTLQVIGVEADDIAANLLLLSPLLCKGHYATLSPFDATADLRQPKGIKQLVQVTFSSSLNWVERPGGLNIILADILHHRKEKKAGSFLYTVLVEFALDYFVPSKTLTVPRRLGGDSYKFDFDYVGLALRCFSCLSIHHASVHCPSKSPLKPSTSAARDSAPATSDVAKELFLQEALAFTEGPHQSLPSTPIRIKDIRFAVRGSTPALTTVAPVPVTSSPSSPSPVGNSNETWAPDSQTPSRKRPHD